MKPDLDYDKAQLPDLEIGKILCHITMEGYKVCGKEHM